MTGKERKKEMKVEKLPEIIENSKTDLRWGEGQIVVKRISPENAQELQKRGFLFSKEYCGRINESQNLPFTFWLDSASSPIGAKLPELTVSSMISFRSKDQTEGRAYLFSLKDKDRLFGLAKFGEKYDGIHHRDLEPGFFALVILS